MCEDVGKDAARVWCGCGSSCDWGASGEEVGEARIKRPAHNRGYVRSRTTDSTSGGRQRVGRMQSAAGL